MECSTAGVDISLKYSLIVDVLPKGHQIPKTGSNNLIVTYVNPLKADTVFKLYHHLTTPIIGDELPFTIVTTNRKKVELVIPATVTEGKYSIVTSVGTDPNDKEVDKDKVILFYKEPITLESKPTSKYQDTVIAFILKFSTSIFDGRISISYDAGDKANEALYKSMILLKYLKMLQKDNKESIACSNEKITYVDGNNCIDTIEVSYDPIMINGFIHEYMIQTSHKIIKGKYDYYDNSGVILAIPIKRPLIISLYPNWITDSTLSIMIIRNFYSLNSDSIIILRFLFEKRKNFFLPNHDIQFLNLPQTVNGFLIAHHPQLHHACSSPLHDQISPAHRLAFPSSSQGLFSFYTILIFSFTFLSIRFQR